jgi:uncharacterized protein (TIGR03546 family)
MAYRHLNMPGELKMLITRKFGKIIRGKATPFQILAACLFGAVIGFTPSFSLAPGLIIALIMLVMVINANLGVAGLVGLTAKPLSLLLMPVTFKVGQFLIDGPAQPFFRWAINAPVLAFMGLEYYATTGGILMGMIYGLLCGIILVVSTTRIRKKMASLEEGSDLYKKVSGNIFVRILVFIFIGGGKGKKTWAEVAEKKFGNPIRILGVVFAALIIVLLVVVRFLFADDIVLAQLKTALENTNGATVDLKTASLDLSEGKMLIEGLAIADSRNLDKDLFRAAKLEADISGTDLLRKRITFERIVASGAAVGVKRKRPGVLIKHQEVEPEPSKDPDLEPKAGEKDLEDYLAQAETWKKRLKQANEWLEKLGSDSEDETDPQKQKESLSQWLEREIERVGYRRVAATHLIEGNPRLLVKEFVADKVSAESLVGKDQTMDVKLLNISSDPSLVKGAPALIIHSSNKKLDLELALNQATRGGGQNTIKFAYRGIETDSIAEQMKMGDNQPISGGTMDVGLEGPFSVGPDGRIDMPMPVSFHNVSFFGLPKTDKPFEFPIGLRGRLTAPYITVDMQKLADNAAKAGLDSLASEAQNRAQQEVDKQVDKAKTKAQAEVDKAKAKLTDKLTDKLGDKIPGEVGKQIPDVDGLLKGVLGGKKKDDSEKDSSDDSESKSDGKDAEKDPIKDAVDKTLDDAFKGLLGK